MNICISVQDKIARVEGGTPDTVCDNGDYNVIFLFDAEWDSYSTKTARFKAENGSYIDVVFEGESCTMPKMADTRITEVGVFSEEIASTAAILPMQFSILSGIGAPTEPAPDVYTQITEKLNKLSEATLLDPPFIITVTGSAAEPQLDKTFNEVHAALSAKQPVYLLYTSGIYPAVATSPASDMLIITGGSISSQGFAASIEVQMYASGEVTVDEVTRYIANPAPPIMPTNAAYAVYLKSPNNTTYKVAVSDTGALSITEV